LANLKTVGQSAKPIVSALAYSKRSSKDFTAALRHALVSNIHAAAIICDHHKQIRAGCGTSSNPQRLHQTQYQH
jgi:hypothetical protein